MRKFPFNSTRRRAVLGLSLLLGVVAACSTESIKPIGLPAGKVILSQPPNTQTQGTSDQTPGKIEPTVNGTVTVHLNH